MVIIMFRSIMTYKQLKNRIEKMTEQQQNSDAVVHVGCEDEYVPVKGISITDEKTCDVLDDKHPVIMI